MATRLLFFGFMEQDDIEENTTSTTITDTVLRRSHSIVQPLHVICTCEISTNTSFALTKNYLYYTHQNRVLKHELKNSRMKLSNEDHTFKDVEVLKMGEQDVVELHGSRDFITVTFKDDNGVSVTVVLRDDGSCSTLQMDVGITPVELVCGKKFGLLRTADNELIRIEQTNVSGDIEFSKEDVDLPGDSEVISQMSCGNEHAIMLTNNKRILTYGGGSRGQLGNGSTGSTLSPLLVDALEPLAFKQVSAGGWHCLALSEEGDIYAWGWNQSGQVGGMPCVPESKGNDEEGSLSAVASEENISKLVFLPEVVDTPLCERFVCVKGGSRHSVAVTEKGDLYSWGWNGYGQLGHGDQEDRYTPAKVVGLSECVVGVECSDWGTLVVCFSKLTGDPNMLITLPVELLQHVFSYCDSCDLLNLSCCSRCYKQVLEPFVWQSVSIPLREIHQRHFTKKKNRAAKLRHVRTVRLGSCPSGVVFNSITGKPKEDRIQACLDLLAVQNCTPLVVHTSIVPAGLALCEWKLLENVVELHLHGADIKLTSLEHLRIKTLSIANKGVTVAEIALLRNLSHLSKLHLSGDMVLSRSEMQALGGLVGLKELVTTKAHIQSPALVELKNLLTLESVVVRDCLELVLPQQWPSQGLRGLDDEALSHLCVLVNLKNLDVNFSSEITDKGLVHLSKLVNLRSLDLSGCVSITDWGIEHITDLQLLEQLFLRGCDVGITYLHRFGNLEKLSIEVSNAGLASISKMLNLKHLFIWSSAIATKVGLRDLSKLVNLESIIFHNISNYLGNEVLASVSSLPNLKVLHMGQPQPVTISESGFKYFTKMTSLEELKLTVQQLDDDALLYITSASRLKNLDLNNNQGFSHVGISYICQLAGLKHLRVHSCFDFTDECLSHVNMLEQLQTLDISSCWAVTDAGIRNLVTLTNLRTLNIGHCIGVTNLALRYVASLGNLLHLNVSGLQISDGGLVHIRSCVKLKRLWVVSCGHITVKGLELLQKLKHLQKLHLTNCSQFLGRNMAEIKKLFPYASVIY